MSRRKQIYEGKAKILYEGPDPGTLVQYFKDDATAFNAQKKAILDGKGVLNNRISEFVMLRLAEIGIPTHFIKRLNMREQLIKKVDKLDPDTCEHALKVIIDTQCHRDDLVDFRMSCPAKGMNMFLCDEGVAQIITFQAKFDNRAR